MILAGRAKSYDIECVPADAESAGEIVDQVVNDGLVLEQLDVLVVDTPKHCSESP